MSPAGWLRYAYTPPWTDNYTEGKAEVMNRSSDPAHQRYTAVAVALHWSIALLILFNLSLGFFMEGFAPPLRGLIVPLHISSGITALALTVLRLVWRLTHRPPPLSEHLSGWERASAHAAHWIIYVLMFALPLTGWMIISAHPWKPTGGALIWGLARLPQIKPIALMDPVVQKSAHESFVTAHSIGGYIFVALLLLHVAGALKHQFFDGEPQFARMGLGRLDSST